MEAIKRTLWSTQEIYLYKSDFLENNPPEELDYEIVFGPLNEIYREYLPQISKWLGRINLEYLRIKLWRGNPYVCIAMKDKDVIHITYFSSARSHREYSLLDPLGYVAGPGITKKEYRGKGILPTVLKYFRASPMGRHGLYGSIVIDNLSSQRAHDKAGYKRILKYRRDIRMGLNFIHVIERYD